MTTAFSPSLYDDPELITISPGERGVAQIRFTGYVGQREPVASLWLGDALFEVGVNSRRIRAIEVGPPHDSALTRAALAIIDYSGQPLSENRLYCLDAIRQVEETGNYRPGVGFALELDFSDLDALLTFEIR